ncbi:MAG: hypothetical protein JF888_11105 [Candidatus Dormibacteraeota bacterium]|uniref:Photosynthesis system II assembly factor Ycf48/Hcf136-like domain-containing protein n=1 Tax=Candidatus Dormiibacter inghamiae TaxID=3127013 RepID=A0A934NE00_9BACT|nr:hypothetical protein [Candidatus Dormibacteraeota bacterium]MBJ7607254.1 hypothetical protein [Candidatus Dormibacteraeota bacterium]
MSPSSLRLGATIVLALLAMFGGAAPAAAGPPASDTWQRLAQLPEAVAEPLLALAVSPSEPATLLAGTPAGNLYRTSDGGQSWKLVKRRLGGPVTSVVFNRYQAGSVVVGTHGDGAWRSTDGGQTWGREAGSEGRSVRAIAFGPGLTLVGSDQGALLSRDGAPLTPSGPQTLGVSAVAVVQAGQPARLVIGADASKAEEALPLFASGDGGQSWNLAAKDVGASSMVSALGAGPAPEGSPRPLLLGTNAGLYSSSDGAGSWQQLTGDPALPAADFSALAFSDRADQFYVASDGGGSDAGGLWQTTDGGSHFRSLETPVHAVTALAVSRGPQPVLYAASFRPVDHAVFLWSYRDAGGTPQTATGAVPAPKPVAQAGAPAPGRALNPAAEARQLLHGPETPFLALGIVSLLVLLLAMGAYVGRARKL